ncbi:hypothetical protein RRG08_039907 [Elysia crispata]|uniref:HTH psq-type domain-containing protein n=1 Tax=Elysia crispata TaxID=231223 RepID=A0AAE0ZWR5_9GAST|nr:hypothetical protein RRG08_039907 [Elysia crispata]
MQEVDSGKTIRQAAKDHGLCHVSLHRRLKKREQGEAPCMGYSKHAQVFSQHQEQELARYVTWSAELRYGLTPVEVRQLAYQCGKSSLSGCPLHGARTGKLEKTGFLVLESATSSHFEKLRIPS